MNKGVVAYPEQGASHSRLKRASDVIEDPYDEKQKSAGAFHRTKKTVEYLSFADNVHSVAPEMAEDDDSECGDADLFQCVEFEQSKIVKQQEQQEKQTNRFVPNI